MRIAVVNAANTKKALGDRIRIDAIIKTLNSRGHEPLDIQVPSTDRLKDVVANILPINIATQIQPELSRQYIRDQLGFVVSRNFLLRQFKDAKIEAVLAETTKMGLVACSAAKKLSIKCAVDVHGLGFAEAHGANNGNSIKTYLIEKEVFQTADHLIAVSNYMKEYIQLYFRIDPNKISVAPNGGQLQPTLARFEKPLNVIFAGSFAYWEKVDDVLELAKKADPNMFKFYLAGAGPLEKLLLDRIRAEKIPIIYLGYIPRGRVYSLFSNMQIGLAPSTHDLARKVASPIKIFDYMSCGLPVVCSKIGDWGEVISKHHCGFALKVDTTDEYSRALSSLADKETWSRMSKNALKAIQEYYNWEMTLGPIADAFDNLKTS
jgi:glycosyltransferase involved in cell wall biosynthesis